MITYEVKARLEGKWWMVEIPALKGLTQARKLKEVELMAREYIAVTRDQELNDFDVTIQIASVHGVPVAEILAQIADDRSTAALIMERASVSQRKLARELKRAKVTEREIGNILGISHQRAHQIAGA